MASSRRMPFVGAPARILHLAHIERVTIVAVDGTRVTVADRDGDESAWVLHRLTGHFHLDGDSVTGPRLALGEGPPTAD
jgi:hypothetical protein